MGSEQKKYIRNGVYAEPPTKLAKQTRPSNPRQQPTTDYALGRSMFKKKYDWDRIDWLVNGLNKLTKYIQAYYDELRDTYSSRKARGTTSAYRSLAYEINETYNALTQLMHELGMPVPGNEEDDNADSTEDKDN